MCGDLRLKEMMSQMRRGTAALLEAGWLKWQLGPLR